MLTKVKDNGGDNISYREDSNATWQGIYLHIQGTKKTAGKDWNTKQGKEFSKIRM